MLLVCIVKMLLLRLRCACMGAVHDSTHTHHREDTYDAMHSATRLLASLVCLPDIHNSAQLSNVFVDCILVYRCVRARCESRHV